MGSYIEDSPEYVGEFNGGDGEAERSIDDGPGLGTLLSGRLADVDCDSVELVRELREDE